MIVLQVYTVINEQYIEISPIQTSSIRQFSTLDLLNCCLAAAGNGPKLMNLSPRLREREVQPTDATLVEARSQLPP